MHDRVHHCDEQPQILCIPSTDRVFAQFVAVAMAVRPIEWTWDLQDALRPFYPECRVRVRELSDEDALTWYAYREWDHPRALDEGI